jgi:hypothetical protein
VTCTGNECNDSVCNTSTGQCDNTPKEPSTACTDTDNNECTHAGCETDGEGVGQCIQTHNEVTCTGDECNDSVCDTSTGQCVTTPIEPPPAQCVQVGCRMTGGKNNWVGDIDAQFGSDGSAGPFYTVGGQIGAPGSNGCIDVPPKGQCKPNADKTGTVCVGGPDDGKADCSDLNPCGSYDKTTAPWGEWEHVHHAGPDDDNNITGGMFAFHAGSHSAPDEAYIQGVACTDPGWCVQARPANNKQIYWHGLGVFQNLKGARNTDLPLPDFPDCSVVPYNSNSNGKKADTPTLHYYTAHVGDFGEPAGAFQKPVAGCSNPGGFDGWDFASCNAVENDTILSDEVTNDKFTEAHPLCTAQDCSVSDPNTGCPDWYDIEIHCTADPESPVIYHVGHYIDEGNFQLHPPVGDSCNPDDTAPL